MFNRNSVNKIQFIIAVILYGTIGMFLRYASLPSATIAMCRGIIGTFFILLYMKIKGININKQSIKNNFKWLILSGILLYIKIMLLS